MLLAYSHSNSTISNLCSPVLFNTYCSSMVLHRRMGLWSGVTCVHKTVTHHIQDRVQWLLWLILGWNHEFTLECVSFSAGELGGTRLGSSSSESLDCGRTGALLRQIILFLLYIRDLRFWSTLEVANMVLCVLRESKPPPEAPSGRMNRILWSTAALSFDEFLEEFEGCASIVSETEM